MVMSPSLKLKTVMVASLLALAIDGKTSESGVAGSGLREGGGASEGAEEATGVAGPDAAAEGRGEGDDKVVELEGAGFNDGATE